MENVRLSHIISGRHGLLIASELSKLRRRRSLLVSENHKRRTSADPTYRATCNIRNRVKAALNAQLASKWSRWMMGCSIHHFKRHIESQFTPGMTWDNYGLWHIDHIKPCASFDLRDPYQQLDCFHYTNLQPLWAADNHRKGARRPKGISFSEG